MILQEAFDKIEQQPNQQQDNIIIDEQKNQDSPPNQQTDINNQPNIPEMIFIQPPVSDSSKYLDQQFLQSITKNQSNLDFLTFFGQRRPIDLMTKKLPQPLFVDNQTKTKLKKKVRSVYEKMIESLKFCAGEMPLNYSSPLPKITQKTHQFMIMCQQLQVAETKTTIWKMMEDQTTRMNEKSQEIEKFIQSMVLHCQNQQLKNF